MKAVVDLKRNERSQKDRIAALEAESASTLEQVERAEEDARRFHSQGEFLRDID